MAWKKNPASVDVSWQKYFETQGDSLRSSGTSTLASLNAKNVLDNLKVESLVRAYLVRGHSVCNLDPLGILSADLDGKVPEEVR